MSISTHVLDTARGRPAAGVPVILELQGDGGAWSPRGAGTTDADGRLKALLGDHVMTTGIYRVRFDTKSYFASTGTEGFYPEVTVVFEVRDAGAHFHVPLLLSPFGFSTYRGS